MLIMGIVNVTPDSFSDGGAFFEPDHAVAQARRLVSEGAEMIDVGGESTRPGAVPVSEAEEIRRVIPVIEALAGRIGVPISIDTMKSNVARRAIESGASVVNNVAAATAGKSMRRLVAETGVGYVAMHMQGDPATMQINPSYENVSREVNEFFGDILKQLLADGVSSEQIILDVGIGFGKKLEHNLELLGHLREFRKWDRPLLLGVSRKSFLGKLAEGQTEQRLPASLACACWAAREGAGIVRVHDVAETRQAVRATEALMNLGSKNDVGRITN
jgi:dihydropteroate synthase